MSHQTSYIRMDDLSVGYNGKAIIRDICIDIQKGDIILSFDGKEVATPEDLTLDVREKNPGDKVDVVVNRNGEEKTITVTLGSDETVLGTDENNSESYGYGYGDGYGGEEEGYGFGF